MAYVHRTRGKEAWVSARDQRHVRACSSRHTSQVSAVGLFCWGVNTEPSQCLDLHFRYSVSPLVFTRWLARAYTKPRPFDFFSHSLTSMIAEMTNMSTATVLLNALSLLSYYYYLDNGYEISRPTNYQGLDYCFSNGLPIAEQLSIVRSFYSPFSLTSWSFIFQILRGLSFSGPAFSAPSLGLAFSSPTFSALLSHHTRRQTNGETVTGRELSYRVEQELSYRKQIARQLHKH